MKKVVVIAFGVVVVTAVALLSRCGLVPRHAVETEAQVRPSGLGVEMHGQRACANQDCLLSAESVVAIADAMKELRPWNTAGAMTASDAARYRGVAGRVQLLTLGDFKRLMEEWDTSTNNLEMTTVPFVLLRFVFDVPDLGSPSELPSFWGLHNYHHAVIGDKAMLSWPLQWDPDRPILVASFEGYEGRPYDAVAEFEFFCGRYRHRQLDNATER